MATVIALGLLAGLATGAGGFSPLGFWADVQGRDAGLILGQIRAPRTLGALMVGALLGLSGAIARRSAAPASAWPRWPGWSAWAWSRRPSSVRWRVWP
jgi:iron complex transport system permease protein